MADTRITIDAQIQMRHDTEANWMAADPVLRVGEPAYTIGMPDRFKIGDGQRKWSELPYLTMLEEDPEGPALPALGELADVEIEQPVEGQALVYDEVRGMWVNRAVSAPDDEPESGPVFEFTFDTTTNKATAEMVAALAEAIADNKLILCNGRTYKFILEQDGMYGLVSDAYMDITDGKLKTSVLAVMASSYDVQLMEEEVPVGTEITEATISGWGFTKNEGTITGITMNGATKGTSGVVDLGNVLTEHQKLKTINGESIVGEGNITIQGGGGATPRVEMTAASAAIEPNKFYVWPMMDELNLTLGAGQTGVMNRYLFQFRNPKAGVTILSLPDDITWSEDTELDENGMPVMEAAAFYRIEIIEGLASLKKWKLVYINFADAEVERVLMSKGIGDGIGITKRDAKAVTTIGSFNGNTLVESFDEFELFENVTFLEGFDNLTNASNLAAFYGCTNFKSIKFPPNFQEIRGGAFGGTTSLEADINIPTLTLIGNNAFRKSGVKKLSDLGNIIQFGTYGTTDWGGEGVCYQCPNLECVVFPASCESIAPYACYGCTALEFIKSLAVTPPSLGAGAFSGSACPIYVPDASVESYKAATNWNGYASRILPMSEFGVVYEDVTANYVMEVGQAYGQVGGTINFTTDTAYEHTKAAIGDVDYVVVKAPSQASSLIQYVDGNNKILKLAVTNAPSSLTRYNIEDVAGATHVYLTSAAGTLQIWKKS